MGSLYVLSITKIAELTPKHYAQVTNWRKLNQILNNAEWLMRNSIMLLELLKTLKNLIFLYFVQELKQDIPRKFILKTCLCHCQALNMFQKFCKAFGRIS